MKRKKYNSLPRLERDSRGYWRARWYANGERRLKSFGADRTRAVNLFSTWLNEFVNDPNKGAKPENQECTVRHLWDAYAGFAAVHYVRADGKPTGEAENITTAFQHVLELYGDSLAVDFSPPCLVDVQNGMIAGGKLVTTTINARIAKIRAVFKWGVARGMFPESVWSGLLAVSPVKPGRGVVVDGQAYIPAAPEPVSPVSEDCITATCAHLPPIIRAMVWFAWWTGARPGEVCALTTGQITTGPGAWTYIPTHHKTVHHGREKVIYIGPRGQDAIRPYLLPDLSAPVFSPRVAMLERAEMRRSAYTPPTTGDYRTWPSYIQRQEEREARELAPAYNTKTFARAIAYACTAAGISPAWSPNQLRHAAGTRLRAQAGLDVAQGVLGHSDAKTTQRYAELDNHAVKAAIERLG